VPTMLESNLRAPLNTYPQQATQAIPFVFTRCAQPVPNVRQSAAGGERIAVSHLPEVAIGVAEFCAEVGKTIDLIGPGLANLPVDRYEIVAINGPAPCCDGARGALGMVVLIDSYAVFMQPAGEDVGTVPNPLGENPAWVTRHSVKRPRRKDGGIFGPVTNR